jgi:hypothetical protein
MPSPFPGMDPYLESPDWFPDLQDNLIVFMKVKSCFQSTIGAS